jgi:hypothetical protein
LSDTLCPTYPVRHILSDIPPSFQHNNYADIYSYLLYLLCFLDLFPASIEDVEKALQVNRLSMNVPVDSANWDMSEQLIALEARKDAMMAYTDDLFLGAQEAHQALWPG